MLPFELASSGSRPLRKGFARRLLPVFIEPAEDEALISWLLRLAARLGVSLQVLARESFGISEGIATDLGWWCRPPVAVLGRISDRTNITVSRLQRMTLGELQPPYHDDEAHARFAGKRYATSVGTLWSHRFAICGHCLRRDAAPYLRRAWLIGWMAVCPTHKIPLIDRCPGCRAPVRPPSFNRVGSFSPGSCTRCGLSFLLDLQTRANLSVTRLQAALIEAKFQGFTELSGVGRLTWQELVGLADVLLSTIWSAVAPDEREQLLKQYTFDPLREIRPEVRTYDCRYDSLRFLAWLLEGWPHSRGAVSARQMLVRWFDDYRLRQPGRHADPLWAYDIEHQIQRRLAHAVGYELPTSFQGSRSHSTNLAHAPGN